MEAKLFDGGVKEEDEGEGRRQDGVVVEVLPPDARPDQSTLKSTRQI